MLLHGVIDSPDIPLNVSRSFLQADSNVKKINNYITRKVAEKLNDLFKNDRAGFEEKFENIGLFVKYGMISDEKFYDKAKDFCLLQSTSGKYYTLNEYAEFAQENQKDKNDDVVYLYATDLLGQDGYIQSATKRGYDVLKLDAVLDSHFINMLETKLVKTNLKRVDADTVEKLIDKGIALEAVLSDSEKETVKKVFDEVINDKNKSVQVEAMPVDELPAIVTQNEFMRRMSDMSKLGGGMGMFGAMPNNYTIAVNANHPLINKILKTEEEGEQKRLAKQVYDLALLSQNLLTGADLTAFIQRTAQGL
jgi:molecular chaperone HtpG